jgi:hypothetical protein
VKIIKEKNGAGDVAQSTLPSMHKALGSIPSTGKTHTKIFKAKQKGKNM